MDRNITIEFGALCDPIEVQLQKQGYPISQEDSNRLQYIADAIIALKIHGIIPNSVAFNSEKKLMKKITEAVYKAM